MGTIAPGTQGKALPDAPEDGAPVLLGGGVDDTAPSSVGEGDVQRIRSSPEGNLLVELMRDNASFFGDVNGIGVQGTAASDVPELGNPVQIGGSVDDTAPTAAAEGDVRRIRVSPEGDVRVAGDIAHDAPDTGFPQKIGGKVSTGSPITVADTDRVDAWFNEFGALGTFITGQSDATALTIQNPDSDGVAVGALTGMQVGSVGLIFNETTIDRVRGNTDVTQLASAARTASTNGPDQTNFNSKGVIITLDVTVDPGGGETLQLLVQHKDAVSSAYESLLDDGANATPGRRTVIVYPGVGAAANDVDTVNGYPLPRTWRVRVVHSAGGSWTYSVGASNIN